MPAQAIVYANTTTRVGYAGRRFSLYVNQPWDATDPLVKQFPALFSKQPTNVATSTPTVEQATRAPGEKRAR